MISYPTIQKIGKILLEKNCKGGMIWGADNITYLTNIVFPFVQSLPHRRTILLFSGEKKTILCTAEHAQVAASYGWDGELIIISENAFSKDIASTIQSTTEKYFTDVTEWAVDAEMVPQSYWESMVSLGMSLTPCDRLLTELRMIKNESEIEKLTKASRIAECGIISALNHTEGTIDAVSYSRPETAERVRVHVAEFGGQAAGQVIALQGNDLRLYHNESHGIIKENDFMRYDLTAAYEGYWASAGRTIYVGKPSLQEKQAYQNNLTLKASVVNLLKPGIKCSEIFEQAVQKSVELGIPFIKDAGVGYGVGISEREAPFLNPYDETVLAENMVIAIDIWTYGPAMEWIHSIDTYAITKDGSQKISWYRDYDRLYVMVGVTARHG